MFAAGKYYSSIGDHLAPQGNAMVFEYDPATKKLRKLVDLRSLLKVPDGQYAPGKIHTRLDMGKDGWLYFATHRGSPRATTDQFGYTGDWIVRVQPASGKAEIVVHAPLAKHSIPTGITDTQRLIFYGGTAPGADAPQQSICFFAYDLTARRLLYAGTDGPARAIILASSTGKAYCLPGQSGMRVGKLLRFDPASGRPPEPVADSPGIRAATAETPQGKVYAVSTGQSGEEPILWAFDVKTEHIEQLGTARVGSQLYITSIDADPTGRYLYYVPGAHGGSQRDGAAVVRFDTQTRKKTGGGLPASVLPAALRRHTVRHLQHGHRFGWPQAVHHLECFARQQSMGLLLPDGRACAAGRLMARLPEGVLFLFLS